MRMNGIGAGSCSCGGAKNGQRVMAVLSRRATIGGLLAAPLLPPTASWAQELLDPTKLSSSRVSSSSGLPSRSRPVDWVGPDYARDMASSVTSAILSLIAAYGSVANQIGALQTREKDLGDKLAAAVRDKASKLDEYRQGLFCSGCGKTKSEILAQGDQFPHPGQHIIAPTPEQIAAKEKELQGVIDRLDAEVKAVRAKVSDLYPDINSIKDQLFAGMSLWRTAISFERRLIRMEDTYDGDAYFRERSKISQQFASVIKDTTTTREPSQLQRGINDLTMWSDTLGQVEARRAREVDRFNTQMAANETSARRQVAQVDSAAQATAKSITAFGMGGYLQILTVQMNPSVDTLAIIGEASGYTFRMGKYDRTSFGELLPRVVEFVGRARNLPGYVAGGSAPPASTELANVGSAVGRLRTRLAAANDEARQVAAAADAKRKADAELLAQQNQQSSAPGSN